MKKYKKKQVEIFLLLNYKATGMTLFFCCFVANVTDLRYDENIYFIYFIFSFIIFCVFFLFLCLTTTRNWERNIKNRMVVRIWLVGGRWTYFIQVIIMKNNKKKQWRKFKNLKNNVTLELIFGWGNIFIIYESRPLYFIWLYMIFLCLEFRYSQKC